MNHFVHCCSFSTSNKITSKGCQSASQTCDFDAKNAKFVWKGGTDFSQTPPPVGRGLSEGLPLPTPHPPWRLRRLDLNPSHSEILPTLLTMMMVIDRAILREIQWLRLQQQASSSPCSSTDYASFCQLVPNSQSAQQLIPSLPQSSQLVPGHLVDELRLLRRRRDELECRMVTLQSSRRQLMCQLDTLMAVLKATSAF